MSPNFLLYDNCQNNTIESTIVLRKLLKRRPLSTSMSQRHLDAPGVAAFIERLSRDTGALLMKTYQSKGLTHHTKGSAQDFATEADLAANKFIVNSIRKQYPSHSIIAEEGDVAKADPNAEYLWIIDPLDGTLNYATSQPLFATSIALLHNNELFMAAVYAPVFDEFYFAQKGKGATLNGERLHGPQKTALAKSIGCIPSHNKSGWSLYTYPEACKAGSWVQALGSAAIMAAYVAAGRRDWLVLSNRKVWDLAAQILIMQEAGCVVTDSNGKPWTTASDEVVATNKHCHKELLELVARARRLSEVH